MYDCIIAGAGYAGLTAALELRKHNKNILILEATERVGGRVLTEWKDNDYYLDLGGQWIGPTQTEMYRLCNSLNIRIFPTYAKGRNSLIINGKLTRYKSLIPPLSIKSLFYLYRGIKRLNKLAGTIPLQGLITEEQTEKWGKISLQDWLNKNVPDNKAHALLKLALEAILAAAPDEVCFLHALFYIHSGGKLERLMEVRNGAQQDRILGGAQLPCIKMAEIIGYENFRFNTNLTKVIQKENEVVLQTPENQYVAKKLILAMPPVALNSIIFEPELPEKIKFITNHQWMGNVIKCYAIYEKPFWRLKNLSGLAALPGMPVSVCFDNSPADGRFGIIMGFSLADSAKKLINLSQEERKNIALECFSSYLGPEAFACIRYTDYSFHHHDFIKGCYAGMFHPGNFVNDIISVYKPFRNIHWAGTETSPVWYGYLEGAVRSGIRAAKEVLNC
ncbi:MAG: FAD-dependent oxidoreductase [Chitinophagaceae bacterium]|nr:FAD-dependent oxidoreductase [Chitinophagaceae bacterium]